jgi:hypothetical protein
LVLTDKNTDTKVDFSEPKTEKSPLNISRNELWEPIVFLLGMTMLGLRFPLGYLLAPFMLIRAYTRDKYHFIVMLTIFCGGYALAIPDLLVIKNWFALFAICLVAMLVIKKDNAILRKTIIANLLFGVFLVAIALTAEESMKIQFRGIIRYLMFIYFIIPFLVFSRTEFDMKVFMRTCMIYLLIIAVFYIIDAFIFCGFVLVPHCHFGGKDPSTFYALRWAPLSMNIPRKYPYGLYILSLCIYPITKYYKLTKWQWVILIVSIAITRTYTFISGVLICFLLATGNFKRILKYGVGIIVALVCLYFVDDKIGYHGESNESTFRIASTVNQIVSLDAVQDDEDLSEFGSGRTAQVLPKLELLYDMGREWLGFGFIDRELTKNDKYIIDNEYYIDVSQSEEVATGVENSFFQTFLTIGYVGLVVQLIFFCLLYRYIRKLKDAFYYVIVLVAFEWWGIGGYGGWIDPQALYMIGLAFSAIILSNRDSLTGFAPISRPAIM